ncbi:sigma-54-dependent Fis family transcriptional regulator [Archangium violaceum]|uniref:sigma-54-dependent transcriptional regulator n=1 Tax=Archangium violaceum TaxID=83451 RepID=UPI00193BC239|nr:sigma 54-interacting transcriptional regulator [Archangium violaceum]QRK08252.1 sigma-54-dependent Fis family transcriptional regulator [Archangium violaceum]
MQDGIQQLLLSLLKCGDFEEAANAVLESMLRSAEEALDASPYARRGRVLRGTVHLRPGEGYLRLAARDARTGPGRPPAGDEDVELTLLTSTTAWRSVVTHRGAVSIDVNAGTVQPLATGAATDDPREVNLPASEFHSPESRQRMLGRRASHVLVLPLRVPGGAIDGLISLEADCPAAMGTDFIWRELAEPLQWLADVAAPYLVNLPVRPAEAATADEFLPVVGAAMGHLLPVMRVFARQDETLLISGPTGAGKSRLARWCHENSRQKQGPFEVLDLMTVPEELQAAELFGWKKGAFTGAVRDNVGAVARAEGGTLFIDEIDKLSLRTQAAMLHVLEERTYRMLGEDSRERHANVRFIIGTNADLKGAVREGRFREDLYYRLNVLPIRLPALDERRDEVPLWARYMAGRRHRQRVPDGTALLTPEAERGLASASWPGNLRQLDNIIRRAYALALSCQGEDVREVRIEERHVAQALSYDAATGSRAPVMERLRAAAEALVDAVERHEGEPVDLDLTDAFRGFVLGVASQRLGREEAFKRFGREKLVATRNHHRALRRELEKIEALGRALGIEQPLPFPELQEETGPSGREST